MIIPAAIYLFCGLLLVAALVILVVFCGGPKLHGTDGVKGTDAPEKWSDVPVQLREEAHFSTGVDGLVILTWVCKCHGWHYSHPSCCTHTSAENLIPPPQLLTLNRGLLS